MIVFELICPDQHRFEGWFASADEFVYQREASLIRCPVCDDGAIERRPSANVQIGRAPESTRAPETEPSASIPVVGGEAETLKLMRRLIAASDDVGSGFAEEARKIHYEEVPKRSIRGQATPEQADELRDEGIDFMSLPGFLTRNLN